MVGLRIQAEEIPPLKDYIVSVEIPLEGSPDEWVEGYFLSTYTYILWLGVVEDYPLLEEEIRILDRIILKDNEIISLHEGILKQIRRQRDISIGIGVVISGLLIWSLL